MNTSYEPEYQIPIVDFLNGIVRSVGHIAAWANIILIGIILTQVVLRYGFNSGMVPLEELMWHLYAVALMFGLSYAITNDTHIRVDLFHMNMSAKKRHIIEIFGILFLLMPFVWVIFHHSLGWVAHSFAVGESSQNPTGLPYRWIIKSVIPISFFMIFIAALARLIRSVLLLRHKGIENEPDISGRVSMLKHLFTVSSIDNNKKGDT
ncbi:MAG: C4-dicarboxylate ABC transporter [uncultured Thiotrichaceae bacterium]|uniref:TRAP transporter small permease protein n=1 Tax=uncultured Thiotrichaceae bacterium TaxID=298394 RepID=A0A6S6TB66_9GAMM|nr:MAG: C4-dicarboxylate ABC transporter [uncultured Thiotrichaceae bacterium]